MKQIKNVALLLVGLIFWSCATSPLPSNYKGYKELDKGIYYKFLDKGVQETLAKEGDVCTFHSTVLKEDLVLSSSYQSREGATMLAITNEVGAPPATKALQLMSEGDSLSLVVLVDSLAQIPNGFIKGDWMEMRIKLNSITTEEARANKTKEILEGFEKHPNGLFHWKKHQYSNGYHPQGGDEIQFNFTLKREETVIYKTRPQLPDMINIPLDNRNISPLHIVMQEMSAGDSITAAFEIATLSEDMKASMGLSGFYDGDVMIMDVGILSIRDTATLNRQKLAALRKQEQDKTNAIAMGKKLDKIMPLRIKQYKAKKIKNLVTTESGLKYVIHQKGNGPVVNAGQTIYVHYAGYLTNQEKKFEASFDKGFAINFEVGKGNVIKGWDEALLSLPVGTKATLFIPYQLAYGEKGRPEKIPPYANLTFYIEIIDFR